MMTQLEKHDIQGFVLSSYAHLPCARYLLLQITDSLRAKKWLAGIENRITTAEKKQEGFSLNLAFTASGLSKLGVSASELETFSRAFGEGMVSGHRSRILGDRGDSAPDLWEWGYGEKSVDILLLIFAADETELQTEVDLRMAEIESGGGLRTIAALAAGRHPDTKEHFGFEDGIGQPVIEGSGSETRQRERTAHATVIKSGEFILGYENELDLSVEVPAVEKVPAFGRNGTYLVFRQIEQDVAGFWRYIRENALPADQEGDFETRADDALELLAAKIVGRWRSGAPLVKYPDRDPYRGTTEISRENDFGYDADDRAGFGCPVGSHIRRANPRDALGPNPETALESVKRHRLLRRGRSYGNRLDNRFTDDGEQRGLNFICLNANLERQFEFVQQTWINNPTFAGLYDEIDPLIGKKEPNLDSFTVQNDPLRQRIQRLRDFVRTKGGAYFFMPGISAVRWLAA